MEGTNQPPSYDKAVTSKDETNVTSVSQQNVFPNKEQNPFANQAVVQPNPPSVLVQAYNAAGFDKIVYKPQTGEYLVTIVYFYLV